MVNLLFRDVSIHGTPLGRGEFIALAALLISTVAMAIDVMLPTLPAIGRDLAVADSSSLRLVISSLFAGLAVGQLLAGPLSDRFGRRPVIFWGIGCYLVGCVISGLADNLGTLLAGRLLQGVGVAAPRVVTVAIIRDQYAGVQMARVMSLVMAVFIMVPALAPSLGQAIEWLAGWRAVFATMFATAAVALIWTALRQPETLDPARRRSCTPASILRGLTEICTSATAGGYTLAVGICFTPFIAYLSVTQELFQSTYQVGSRFPLYFAVLAISFGVVSLLNARLLAWRGMSSIATLAAGYIAAVGALAWLLSLHWGGVPPLWLLLAGLMLLFAGLAALWGNLNALAMESLGHMAGLGAAAVAFLSTCISVGAGALVAQAFDGSPQPLFLAFSVCGALTGLAIRWAGRGAALPRPSPAGRP